MCVCGCVCVCVCGCVSLWMCVCGISPRAGDPKMKWSAVTSSASGASPYRLTQRPLISQAPLCCGGRARYKERGKENERKKKHENEESCGRAPHPRSCLHPHEKTTRRVSVAPHASQTARVCRVRCGCARGRERGGAMCKAPPSVWTKKSKIWFLAFCPSARQARLAQPRAAASTAQLTPLAPFPGAVCAAVARTRQRARKRTMCAEMGRDGDQQQRQWTTPLSFPPLRPLPLSPPHSPAKAQHSRSAAAEASPPHQYRRHGTRH